MQDPLDRYAAKCTKREMTNDDLKEMLLTEQDRVLNCQHTNYDCIYLGVHSGTLAVTFSQPRTDPMTDEEINDGFIRACITPLELGVITVDWSRDSDCTKRFQAMVTIKSEETMNCEETSTFSTSEQEFCFAVQARRCIEEAVPHFDAYPIKTVNGCELVDTFSTQPFV